jgi:serine/threonine-protein kinase
MSPEQMRSAKDVDARSDIWSIGVCLYELLTGRVPFDAGGVAEICAMVLKDPVTPPSRWVRGLPPDLEAIVLRCLEKDPSRRFQDVAQLAFALETFANDEGSARRNLHVMQTAQKMEVPTIVSDGTHPMMEDVRAGTMAAFSTGAMPARASKFPVWIPLGIVSIVMLAVGVTFIYKYGLRVRPTAATQPSGEVATISPAVEPTAPPPPPIPPSTDNPVGVATAEPNAPIVAATTTATATQPRTTGRPSGPMFGTQRTAPTKPPATPLTAVPKPTAATPPVVPTPPPTPTNKDPGAKF